MLGLRKSGRTKKKSEVDANAHLYVRIQRVRASEKVPIQRKGEGEVRWRSTSACEAVVLKRDGRIEGGIHFGASGKRSRDREGDRENSLIIQN